MSEKTVAARTCLICDCEGTMALDGARLGRALGVAPLKVHSHLCRAQIADFESSLPRGGATVACTQEAPLFSEVAQERGFDGELGFVNVRETAGWTTDGDANPKIAALLAAAQTPFTPTGRRALESAGVCLVYGSGQAAVEVATRLAGRLSVALLLCDPDDAVPPDIADFTVARGRIVAAAGHLGAFGVTVDGYAPLSPSSRGTAEFVMPRDGAKSECDLVFDMSGGTPLFSGHDRRDGYVRADPARPGAVAEAMFEIVDQVGTFEKPLYVAYDPSICAHGASGRIGCTKCLDICPLGAVAPDGDKVAFDAGICGGCGGCAALCPSGAVSYRYPRAGDLIARIGTLLSTFLAAGGEVPALLFHDETHGGPLISAIARHGRGLPVSVLPVSTHSVTSLGHETLLSALAMGAQRIAVLAPPSRRDEIGALEAETALARAILDGFGLNGHRIEILVEADPDAVEARLYAGIEAPALPAAALSALGGRRETARTAILKLRDIAAAPPEIIALPATAPYGTVHIDTASCTLCLACVSACPADALVDNPDRPEVRFVESACLQCGICRSTCPESVITLEPRLDLTSEALRPRTLNHDEPFHCVECGKPFGARSTIERITERLDGRHSMFQRPGAARVIQMCDDCRIVWQANQADNPFATGARPRTRTTDDYVKARQRGLSVDDFLSED